MDDGQQNNEELIINTSLNIDDNINNNQIPGVNLMNIDNNTSHLSSQNNQKIKSPKLIWADYNITGKENSKYKNELNNLVNLIECKDIEQGLNEIKKIKFERVMVMFSKTMFSEFIPLFEKEKGNIFCTLNIIVFTKKNNKSYIEDICNKNKDISLGYIFNKVNVFDKFKEIKEFIIKEKERKKEKSIFFPF